MQLCKGLCSESSEQPDVCNTPFAGYVSAQGIVEVWKKSLNASSVSLNGIFVLMKLQRVEVRLLYKTEVEVCMVFCSVLLCFSACLASLQSEEVCMMCILLATCYFPGDKAV